MTTNESTGQPSRDVPPGVRRCPAHYELRVIGHLSPRWAAWFDGLELRAAHDGTTAISGPVADQAALHGLLARLRDLGLPLVSLVALDTPSPSPDPTPPGPPPTDPTSSNPPGATP